MPKSKRAKVVSLTNVSKKGKERKIEMVDKIRGLVDKFRFCHIIQFSNIETPMMQALREALKPGRFVATKNTLIQIALGKSVEASHDDNIYKLANLCEGNSACLLTDDDAKTVQQKWQEYLHPTYAVAGDIATETVQLESGFDALASFPHSMEPELRKCGLPTKLVDARIQLMGDFVVCQQGEPLTANAAKLLRHLNMKQAQFTLSLRGTWNKKTKKVTLA